MADSGIVYLVGAGPGAPDLISVRGLDRIRRADAIVYDRLVDEALLEEAPPHAERIPVGKRPGRHDVQQEAIDALIVERAREGKAVVRLKGGDPFVFGRGGEEALACARAGVQWEVVPGITSSVGVPTSVGIPLTHRGVAASFAVVSAHRAADDETYWAGLAAADTLVVMMGASRLAEVASALIAHGRSPTTPVAVVERGTTDGERIVTGTLETIADTSSGVTSPAVIVVGEVVNVREELRRIAVVPHGDVTDRT